MKFNLNNWVKVRLTKRGRDVLQNRYDAVFNGLCDMVGTGNAKVPPFKLPETDSDGYSKFQLWKLMEIFGSEQSLFKESTFDLDIILCDAGG